VTRPRAVLVLCDRTSRALRPAEVEIVLVADWAPFDAYSRRYPALRAWAIRLEDRAISFGRSARLLTPPAVAVAAGEVSRRHCRVLPTDAGYAVQDLGSTGGIGLNDSNVTNRRVPVPLTSGDYFFLGGYVDRRVLYFDDRGLSTAPAWAAALVG